MRGGSTNARLQICSTLSTNGVTWMSRKRLSAVAACGIAVGLVLSGCASEEAAGDAEQAEGTCLDAAPDGQAVAGTAVRGSLEGQTITFAAYGGEYQEAQDKAFLQPFAECTGVKILQAQSDFTKLEAMVSTGNVDWDVVYAGGTLLANRCDDLAEPIDTAKVDISESINGLYSKCQVSAVQEASYLVYNTEMFADDPPSGMTDFFDLDKYPGKRLIYGLPSYPDVTTWSAVASSLGWSEESGQEFPFEEVLAKLEGIKEHLVYYQTGAQLVQMLEQADIAMSVAWSGRAYNAARNGAPYVPVFEDMAYSVVDFYVPKGAKDPEASFALLNYMMGAEQQATLTELFVYSPDNKNAQPEVPEDMAPFVPSQEDFAAASNNSTDYFKSPDVTKRILEDRQKLLIGG